MAEEHRKWNPGELLVYLPVGVAATVKDAVVSVVAGDGSNGVAGVLSSLAARGRREVAARREQIDTIVGLARSFGNARSAPTTEPPVHVSVEREDVAGDGPLVASVASVESVAVTNDGSPDVAAHAGMTDADLPIPDYDTLSATQIAQRLGGLDREELLAVRAYEDATRRRRTIVGRIDALVAASNHSSDA